MGKAGLKYSMIKCNNLTKNWCVFCFAFLFLLLFVPKVQANPMTDSPEENVAAQDTETSSATSSDDSLYADDGYDIGARSAFRTMLAALGGEIQEKTGLLLDSMAENYQRIVAVIRDEFVLDLVPQAPKKKFTTEFAENNILLLKSTIASGDSLGSLLNGWIPFSVILKIVEDSKDIYSLTSLRVNQPFVLAVSLDDKSLVKFEYELDNSHKILIDFNGQDYQVKSEEIVYDYELNLLQGTIKTSFFNAVTDLGEGASFAIRLADVFTYDIDFAREIKENDTFSAVVEKRYRDGKFNGYGRIIAAKFVNNGKVYEAYLYHDSEEDGKLSYFNAKGEALQKAFMRTPVHFTRISSHFTMRRKHPILGITRPHPGIDYAAPKGTPVMAVGDGTVTRAAYTGGYGHLIILKHRGGYETQYAHLSGYAKGIKKGASVEQGEVIGYVGSTGLSTGPHLDFRIRKNGEFVDPDKIIIPSKPPLREDQMEDYAETVGTLNGYLEAQKDLKDFEADKWLQGLR